MIGFSNAFLTVFWLAILILLLVIELITVGLTCIWGVGGALVAMILSLLKVSFGLQVVAFLAVTAVLLIFTRPFAQRFVNTKKEKTNYEGIIGKTVRIEERVDNISQTGMAVVNGQEWTVRSEDDNKIIEPGKLVKIVGIKGVKLIVREEEDKVWNS